MHVCCLDRGRTRDRQRMAQFIGRKNKESMKAAAAEIEELDKEADHLADKLVEQLNEKLRREFEISLLKDEVKLRKTYPWGGPPGPSRTPGAKRKGRRENEERC